MSDNLHAAHKQWINRPPDERFATLTEMQEDATNDMKSSREFVVNLRKSLRIVHNDEGDICFQGKESQVPLGNLAFEQLMVRLGYPKSAFIAESGIARLPDHLVSNTLNYLIQNFDPEAQVSLLMENGINPRIRCITSDQYARIYDAEIIPYLQKFINAGWMIPPARPVFNNQPGTKIATEEDIIKLKTLNGGGIQVKIGDPIAPAGLYRGDRDMFAFMINPNGVDDGDGNSLMRGIMLTQSEVGRKAFKVTKFLCQAVCGNHIIWHAQDVVNVKYKHIGDARNRIFHFLEKQLPAVQKENLDAELQVMSWMRKHCIGRNRDEVTDNTYKMLRGHSTSINLSQKDIRAGYNMAEEFRIEGDPNTFMGLVNGLTRYSQMFNNTEDRWELDRATAGLFEIAEKHAFA